MKYGFLGCGFMGSSMIRAICKKVDPADVILYNPTREKAELLAGELGCAVADSAQTIIEQSDWVMLCMKPQDLETSFSESMPVFKAIYDTGRRQVVASLVAAWDLTRLTEAFRENGMNMPIVRLIPNIAVTAGKGVILMAGNDYAGDEVDRLCQLLSAAGLCQNTTERMMDIACPVFSCSPAFIYMFIDGLAAGGVRIGMDRTDAVRLAAQATMGCASLVLETGKYLEALRDEACSPAGITIAGIEKLERDGFRGLVMQAVVECFRRQEKMAAGDCSI